ncbi:hypothetical protein CMI37_09605 [Candidatus Pacearchaeota archaeon]|nr:hypothetical protein [Candidatus Pacearchaeota archaeon]
MPRIRTLQTAFNSGVLDPRLAARVDIKQYFQGADTGTNVLALPQGGFKRRPGMAYAATLGAESRLFTFSFNVEQTYVMAFQNNAIKVYMDGALQATVTTTYTLAQCGELNITQSADTMIIVHEDHQPAKLVRGAAHTSWTLSNITLSNIPQFDFGSGDEDVWSATRGWPKTVAFFEQRLWFGGSQSRPQTLWASQIADFYNFDVDTGEDDDAIDVTLDTNQINGIVALMPSRHLQIFTIGGEFYIASSPITPTNIAVKNQTKFGSASVPPINIDGATLFLDYGQSSVREFVYSWEEEAYTSNSATLLASHLISTPVDMGARRGTSTEDANYVYVVNTDGTMAVFNTLRAQQVAGWTKWETSGTIEAITVEGSTVWFAVKRTINSTTVYYLEKADSDTYTDANKSQTQSSSTTVSNLAHLNGQSCRVRADGAIMADATPSSGSITLARAGVAVEVGLDYDVTIKTMPITSMFGDGSILTNYKRVIRVVADMYESLGVYVNGTLLPDRQLGEDVLDTTPASFTGIKELYLTGWTRLAQVEITQTDPQPFTLLGLVVEVEA